MSPSRRVLDPYARSLVALAVAAGVACIMHGCGSSTGDTSGTGGGDGGADAAFPCGDTSGDPHNCGSCGVDCGGDVCCSGACVATASCAFSVTGATPANGYQNGGEWITLKGAGFVKGMRVHLGDGRAPTLVLDPGTARVQAPPGLPGTVDVTIEAGSQKATLKKGYSYASAGLAPPWKSIPMATVRGEDPALTVLQDGRVLIAGGTTVPDSVGDSLATAEVFLRSSEAVVATAGPMAIPRWHDDAITLLDGKVLVVGGACADDGNNCQGDASSADLFDPSSNTFAPTSGKMNKPRAYARSVLLPDGRVLVSSANDPTLEVYDPETGTFALVANAQPHPFGFMVRLRDGRALLGGGDGGVMAVQLFDPDTNQVTFTGPLAQGRSMLTAHTLPDGRVLVDGGSSNSAGGIDTPLDSIELYDPASGAFSTAPYKLSIGRTWQAGALVRDGTVLVMGGYTVKGQCSSSVGTVDVVDPIAGTVTPFAALPDNKTSTEWTAVTLLDGSIVAVGGGACGTSRALPEIYFLPGAQVK